jgi:hypothetical protein
MGLASVLSKRYRSATKDPMEISRRVIETAESFHADGLDSRIPFLKYAMTGQDVPGGSTARREDGVPVPGWREGQVVFSPMLDEALRFNIFNAGAGLQGFHARLLEEDDTPALVVARCRTSWRGDLRMSVTEDPAVRIRYGAVFNRTMNHIIMRGDVEKSKSALAHEFEHARHANLALMALGDIGAIPVRRMEYLAMLAETLYTGEFPMLDISMRRWPAMLGKDGQIPHILSSFNFLLRLPVKHEISIIDLAKCRAELRRTGKISPAHEGLLHKIWHCAKSEYDRVYEDIFGISRTELIGLVSELPMI